MTVILASELTDEIMIPASAENFTENDTSNSSGAASRLFIEFTIPLEKAFICAKELSKNSFDFSTIFQ